MTTNYATLNNNIASAIKNHLINVDALPPTEELPQLSRELTEVVFAELNNAGITRETIESLGVPAAKAAAKTQGT